MMKQAIMSLLLFLIDGLVEKCIGQTSPSESVGRVGVVSTYAELTYQIVNGDTTYTLEYYHGQKLGGLATDRRKFSFPAEGNALNEFYFKLKSFFTDENRKNKKYTMDFKLGKERVTLKHYSLPMKLSVNVIFNNGSFALTEKQVDKLFGKAKTLEE